MKPTDPDDDMNRIPRASLSITILNDEDFAVLMGLRGGVEAFGVFVAMVVVGRERLQHGQARRLSESDSLTFDNSLSHLSRMARVTTKQLDAAIERLATVATETNTRPWMYLDESGHLVIRSFFKFNVSENHGGARKGAGRPRKVIQDEFAEIQDEINLNKLEKPPSPSPSPSPFPSPELCVDTHDPETDLPPDSEPDGPVGENSAADVREVLWTAETLWPMTSVRIQARQWLAQYPAKLIIAAMTAAHDAKAKNVGRYVASLLDNPEFGKPKSRAPAPRPAAKPALSREEQKARISEQLARENAI